MRASVVRAINGLRRLASGLPPSEEAVWPGVRNDLFVAHESVYLFASRFVAGQRVLDAACGTGYGSHMLASRGAQSVLGVDLNPRRIIYARRRFPHPGLTFEVADCDALGFAPDSFDFVISSNTLEHLHAPERFLRSMAHCLSSAGRLLVTVPPVLSAADLEVHATNPFHVAPLSVQGWADLFTREGWSYEFFAHRSTQALDLRSPYRSKVSASAFTFEPASIAAAYSEAPISATYLLRRRS